MNKQDDEITFEDQDISEEESANLLECDGTNP